MRILCLDDEELALQMLEMCVKKAKPKRSLPILSTATAARVPRETSSP